MNAQQLSALADVGITDDVAEELVALAIGWASLVGTKLARNSEIRRRLTAITNAVSRILRQIDDDTRASRVLSSEILIPEVKDSLIDIQENAEDLLRGCEQEIARAGPGRQRDNDLDGFVGACRELWLGSGGDGAGSYKSAHAAGGYDGPLLRLVDALLKFGGCPRMPSKATIHRSITRACSTDQVKTAKT